MPDKALAGLLLALVGASAAVAVLKGWRELVIAVLFVVAGISFWRAGATPARRLCLMFRGVAVGAVLLVAVLIGMRPSDAPQSPVVSSQSPSTAERQDQSTSPPDMTEGSAKQDEGTLEPSSCLAEDEAEVPCSAVDAALVLEQVATCSRDGVTVAWGLDPELDNLLINAVAGSDGDSCLVSPDASSRAAGATALDLARARDGTVAPALRACARNDGTFLVPCNERHELELIGPWRTESSDDVTQSCRDVAVRYTGANLAGPSRDLSSLALWGRTSTGEQRFRCAVVADRALDDSVRSLGGAELPTAED